MTNERTSAHRFARSNHQAPTFACTQGQESCHLLNGRLVSIGDDCMARLPGMGNCRNIAVAVSFGQKPLDGAFLMISGLRRFRPYR
jgi:hypothetical protein